LNSTQRELDNFCRQSSSHHRQAGEALSHGRIDAIIPYRAHDDQTVAAMAADPVALQATLIECRVLQASICSAFPKCDDPDSAVLPVSWLPVSQGGTNVWRRL